MSCGSRPLRTCWGVSSVGSQYFGLTTPGGNSGARDVNQFYQSIQPIDKTAWTPPLDAMAAMDVSMSDLRSLRSRMKPPPASCPMVTSYTPRPRILVPPPVNAALSVCGDGDEALHIGLGCDGDKSLKMDLPLTPLTPPSPRLPEDEEALERGWTVFWPHWHRPHGARNRASPLRNRGQESPLPTICRDEKPARRMQGWYHPSPKAFRSLDRFHKQRMVEEARKRRLEKLAHWKQLAKEAAESKARRGRVQKRSK